MNLDELFQNAVENPCLRQQFIDSIDLGEISQFVRNVKYRNLESKTPKMDCEYPLLLTWFDKFKKSRINVYPSAFSLDHIKTSGDFLSTLIDHEGFHAMEFYLGRFNPPTEFEPFLYTLYDFQSEVKAYKHQQENLDRRNVSDNFRLFIASRLENYQREVRIMKGSLTRSK